MMADRDPYSIRDIFEDMAMGLIANMKRNLSRHQTAEEEEGFKWEQWQAAKLRNLTAYRRRNRLLIKAAGDKVDQLVDTVVTESFDAGYNGNPSLWDKLINLVLKPFGRRRVPLQGEVIVPPNIKSVIPPTVPDLVTGEPKPMPWEQLPPEPSEEDFFHINEKKLDALRDGIKKDLRKATGAAYRQMEDVYRQVIYKASHYTAAGVKTIDQAVDMATKDFLDRGIDCITYADGRRVNIASYAEMALRTVSQRATFLGEGKKRDEWGVYTVVMSAHANCSPWCLPYQGTVMIDDVYTSLTAERSAQMSKDTGYVLLSTAFRNNAFHPACRHTLATFFPGVSVLPVKPEPEKAAATYEAEQRQRYMERQIRQYKRREVGSLDPGNQAKASSKVNEWQGRLQQHMDEHDDLRRDKRREAISGEVSKAERKGLLKAAENKAKIEEIRKLIKSDKQPKKLHLGQQGKHIEGHNNYVSGKSYLTISPDEVQTLVDMHAGTGEVRLTRNGEWNSKEIILTDEQVGVYIDQDTAEELAPDGFTIHYGKKGTHIVPYRKQR
jgi:hypothetical protein